MEINEKLEVFFGAAIGAANSQSESMLDEQKNIYQSAMEEHEQSCRDALKSSRRIFLEKQKKEVYTSVTVNIVLTGSFYKAAAFLDDLQQQKRLAVPANVVIERSKNDFAGDVVLTASLTAYALK